MGYYGAFCEGIKAAPSFVAVLKTEVDAFFGFWLQPIPLLSLDVDVCGTTESM